MANLFINILLTIASIFGLYTVSRLYAIRQTHIFYILWLLSTSLSFFGYLLMKNKIHEINPLFHETIILLFHISPGFLYLFFIKISNSSKTWKHHLLLLLPVFIIIALKAISLWLNYDSIYGRVNLFQFHINTNSAPPSKIAFKIEKLITLTRTALMIFYLSYIHKELKSNSNVHLFRSWTVIFKPIKIFLFGTVFIIFSHWIIQVIFQCDTGEFFFIHIMFSFAAIMNVWHSSLIIKDLEKSNSIFKAPSSQTNTDTQIPQISLAILEFIYQERIYIDSTLSIENVAEKMGSKSDNIRTIFATTIPFSYSTYINYLRLLEYEKGFNSKFDKTSNALNAGFNSLSAFYYWESKRNAIAKQINPIIEHINKDKNAIKKAE